MNDLLNDETEDLLVIDGDFGIGESDEQHQANILKAQPGSFKNVPDGTVGIESFLMDDNIDGMIDTIRSKFKDDGCPVTTINYNDQTGDLIYNAPYS